MRLVPRSATLALFLITLALLPAVAHGVGRYDPGASDTEIKIGNTNPYSGPASAYGTIGKVIAAYFRKVNEEGGIKGRKITFISLDDGYSPPKTVEQARRLVEQEEVLFLFQTLGTPSNTAIWKYLNDRKIPQLFVATGATKWGDPVAEGNVIDAANVYGYSVAQTLVHVLRQCGDDLTRANVMRQAANIKDLALPMALPAIRINTSPTDFYPIEQEQLARFNGEYWALFGEVYDAAKIR